MYFEYFLNFCIIVQIKFQNYVNIFRIFGNRISKCYNLIGKNLPLPAHSLYYSLSMQLKLFHLHYETPCTIKIRLFAKRLELKIFKFDRMADIFVMTKNFRNFFKESIEQGLCYTLNTYAI